MTLFRMKLTLFVLILYVSIVYGLKHVLDIKDDPRRIFKIETFGFNPGGTFKISFRDFSVTIPKVKEQKIRQRRCKGRISSETYA